MKIYLTALIAIAVLAAGSVKADSAIAISASDQFVFSFTYNHSDLSSARQDAMARCLKQGGSDCSVVMTCSDAGFGSLYIRKAGIGSPVEAYAVVCGHGDAFSAAAEARRRCEFEVAQNLGAISSGLYEDWSFPMIRNAIARSCPALGNCSCNERSQWYDSDPD